MEWSTVTDWLSSHGVRILIVVLISFALYLVLHRVIPRALQLTVSKRMAKKPEEEIEQRIKTLSRVFLSTGAVFIMVAAAFMILSEIGINITPVVAGFGIAGIAIGLAPRAWSGTSSLGFSSSSKTSTQWAMW